MEDAQIVRELLKDKEKMYELFDKFIRGKYPKVYFIRMNEYVKVGKCTSDFSLRLSDLQIGSPYKLEMEDIIPGDHALEQKIHKALDDYWVRGEWFKIEKEELKSIVKQCRKK